MKKNHAPPLARKYGKNGWPIDVSLGVPLGRHLGVLLAEHDEQVRGDQRQQDAGNQQHVDDVHPRHDVVTGERPAEQEERQVGADDRDALQDALEDPQAGAGQLVVGQRVTEKSLDEPQREQRDPDQPVDLAGLAVGAGEEHPQHVDRERGHEQVGGPVVDLPHQQPAADIEADVQRRLVRLADREAVELGVRAVVDHVGRRRDEEERQEGPGQQQDDERPQRDLAEHERPVVGKHLPHEHAEPARPVEPVVEPPAGAAQGLGNLEVLAHPRSQKLGPTGWVKSLLATRYPYESTVIGSCGSGRAAGPKITSAPSPRRRWTGGRGTGCGAWSAHTAPRGSPRACRSWSRRRCCRPSSSSCLSAYRPVSWWECPARPGRNLIRITAALVSASASSV